MSWGVRLFTAIHAIVAILTFIHNSYSNTLSFLIIYDSIIPS